MTASNFSQAGEPASASRQCQTHPSHRILVVDDDISNRQLISEMLRQSGYQADAAADGAAGWEALQAQHYDLLITDNFMPKVTGVEMVKMLRGQNATLPVIMATGTIPTEQLTRHPWLAISAFLPKPYSVGQMLRTVKKVLREADRPAAGSQRLMYSDGKHNKLAQDRVPAGAPPRCPTNSSHRILVVEDDGDIRRLNTEVLMRSGYRVDAAEDGAVAWDTLQRASYDLMVTDNDMPKMSGVELLKKLHAARVAMPVIIATGTLPKEEFTQFPWLQPAAMLLKPYSFKELLGTVKNVLCLAVPLVMLQFCLNGVANAQEVKPATAPPLQSPDSAAQPSAMTISVLGKCEYSEDGVTFTNLAKGHVLEQGAIVRTGADARTDLFFRRTGTTVRLQAGTEIRIEKMTLTLKDGLPVVHTLLDLRAGRIFTVVRSEVAGSTLEIRNAAGRSVVEGSGVGRYIITADGTHVSDKGSVIPLKVIGENGITTIEAGQQYARKEGKMLAVTPPLWVKDMVQLDELQAITEQPAAKEPTPKP